MFGAMVPSTRVSDVLKRQLDEKKIRPLLTLATSTVAGRQWLSGRSTPKSDIPEAADVALASGGYS